MTRRAVPVLLALLLGAALGAGAIGLRGDRAPPATADPSRVDLADAPGPVGTLAAVPPGPLEVLTETVRLQAGFAERHVHGGPTFNTIVSGRVRVVEDDGRTLEYGPGGFFFEPADSPHVIEILEPARIDVLRLLPDGAAGTTRAE